MMFLGRLMRSAMVLISLKAFSMARSELLMVRRFWYLELPNSSKLAAPVPCGGRERALIRPRPPPGTRLQQEYVAESRARLHAEANGRRILLLQ